MARISRLDIPNMPYHVLNRAVGKLTIFKKPEDYILFLEILREAQHKTGMRILAFTIMPNHWHLILYPKKKGDLAQFMHALTNTHTRQVHTRTQTDGHGPLYQGRYKSFIMCDDSHVLTVLKYVERNPVRAKLITGAVDTWRWGSAWVRKWGSLEDKKLLHPGPVPLPRNYTTWVNTPDSAEALEHIHTAQKRGRPFGPDDWVAMMVRDHNLESTVRGVGRPRS